MFHRPSTNHLKFGEKAEPSHFKTFDIFHKFSDANDWQPRSKLIIGYDSREYIASVEVNTPSTTSPYDMFTEPCAAKDKMYQMMIPTATSDGDQINLMTSVDPCLYSTHAGLNETLNFYTLDGKDFTSFSYNVYDWEFLASREKRAKTKRLMLTPDFESWETKTKLI